MAAEREKKTKPIDLTKLLSRAVIACLLIVIIGGGVLLYGQAEHFLMRDGRFFMERAVEYGDPPPNIRIDGIHYADKDQILKIFEEDLGRSVYLLPIGRRREQLMANNWIREATVARLWPNQLSVQIVERRPIAFVKREGGQDTTVIDGEGVLMDAPSRSTFSLPAVSGVGPETPLLTRAVKMHRVERLIKELGNHIADIGEIEAKDSENLKVVQPFRKRAVTLILGNKNFKLRYENFLSMADQLMDRLPNAITFDLRLEEQVTAAEERRTEPKVTPRVESRPAEVAKPQVKTRKKRGQ